MRERYPPNGELPCGHSSTAWEPRGDRQYDPDRGRTVWDGRCGRCGRAVTELWDSDPTGESHVVARLEGL